MADRYFINGGVNSNWDTSGNWSATDGGSASGVKPAATDAVFFTSNSPNCTVNTAGVGLTLNFTGYASTITMTAGLTISGSVTLVAAMTISGASALTVNTTATLTSNGKVWPNALSLTGLVTYTLADNWDVDGLLTLGAASNSNMVVNGAQITASAGFTYSAVNGLCSGTTNIILDGTGTVTGPSGTGQLKNNLTINTAGTLTFVNGGTFAYNTGTFTYTAGTVVTTGHTLNIGATGTLALGGITWNIVNLISLTGAMTLTLSSDITASGLITVGLSTQATTLNGSTINAGAGFRNVSTSGAVSGTTVIKFTGTGTVDAPSITSGTFLNPITIAAGAGTVTIATAGDTAFPCKLNLLKFESGTVVTDSGTWTAAAGGGGNANILGGSVVA